MVVTVDVVQGTVSIAVARIDAITVLVDAVANDLDGEVVPGRVTVVTVEASIGAVPVLVPRAQVEPIAILIDTVAVHFDDRVRAPAHLRLRRLVDRTALSLKSTFTFCWSRALPLF